MILQTTKSVRYLTMLPMNNFYNFGRFTDRLLNRQENKRKQKTKQQIELMAAKPSYTIMDYKQKLTDQLNSLQKSITKKMSAENKKVQQQLEQQSNILNALFEEQLRDEKRITGEDKREIERVTQIPYMTIVDMFNKIERQRKLHALLRKMKEGGEELPEDMAELQYLYQKSGLELQTRKGRYFKYKPRSRRERIRYLKFNQQ